MNAKRVKNLRHAFKVGWEYLRKNNKLPVLPPWVNKKVSHIKYFWRKYKQVNRNKILKF